MSKGAGALHWRFTLVLLAGVAQSASLAWPLDFLFPRGQSLWWMQMLAVLVFAIALERTISAKQAACLGLTFQASTLAASLYWLQIAMANYGGMSPVLAWLAVMVLAIGLAVYGAGATLLYALLRARGVRTAPLVFAAAWQLAELARAQWLTGFGWASGGYAHVAGPLSPLAPWLGVYGIGFASALVGMGLAQSLIRRHWQSGVLWIGAIAAIAALPLTGAFTQESGSLRVVLLQGNIAQDQKFDTATGVVAALTWYSERLRNARGDLVLAPETAIPVLPQQLPDGYLDAMAASDETPPPVKLVGIPLGSYGEGYTNSVIAVGARTPGNGYRYDKHHLVPFGEFIPPLFKWFVRLMDIPLGDFSRGALLQQSMEVRGARVSPSICFEDLFPEELAVRFLDVADSPTVFANFSNLAWFGDSSAMYQHLHISQMRSLEFERPFLRVSNTGITAVLNHEGAVTAALPAFTRGVLEARVQGREGLTPFAWWSARYGQWPLWILGLMAVLLPTALRSRKCAERHVTVQT